MQPINASSSPEVQMNEGLETLEWGAVYGNRQSANDGLIWGYYGGIWGGHEIDDGTITLTNNAANYLVVERETGEISKSTSTTNWDNLFTYARVYRIETLSGLVDLVDDHRAGPGGIFGASSSAVDDPESLDWARVYGKNSALTSGLTWAYYGGRWSEFEIAADDITLTDDADNYIVANRASGVLSVSASDTNWNNDAVYARVYKVSTYGGGVDDVEDHRIAEFGVFSQPPASGGGGGATEQEIFVHAQDMVPGASNPATLSTSSVFIGGSLAAQSMDFAGSADNVAGVLVPMPTNWDGTIDNITPYFIGGFNYSPSSYVLFDFAAAIVNHDEDANVASFGSPVQANIPTDMDLGEAKLWSDVGTGPVTPGGTVGANPLLMVSITRPADGDPSNAAYLLKIRIDIGLTP